MRLTTPWARHLHDRSGGARPDDFRDSWECADRHVVVCGTAIDFRRRGDGRRRGRRAREAVAAIPTREAPIPRARCVHWEACTCRQIPPSWCASGGRGSNGRPGEMGQPCQMHLSAELEATPDGSGLCFWVWSAASVASAFPHNGRLDGVPSAAIVVTSPSVCGLSFAGGFWTLVATSFHHPVSRVDAVPCLKSSASAGTFPRGRAPAL
jgi:hypothetical protein